MATFTGQQDGMHGIVTDQLRQFGDQCIAHVVIQRVALIRTVYRDSADTVRTAFNINDCHLIFPVLAR